MNFLKYYFVALIYMPKLSMADSHDAEQNIIEKAKEINKKVKQNKQPNNISQLETKNLFH